MERPIAANIAHNREVGVDRLVSDFIAEFDGLSGSAKRTKVLDQAGLKRAALSELVIGGRLDTSRIALLLAAMQAHSRPVRSPRLMIGEEHLRRRLLDLGCLPNSFNIVGAKKIKDTKCAPYEKARTLPWVLESAFGYLGPVAEDSRKIFAGANWSAAIKNPFRSFGSRIEGLEGALTDMKVGEYEPVIFVIHLAHPRVEYTESALIVGDRS